MKYQTNQLVSDIINYYGFMPFNILKIYSEQLDEIYVSLYKKLEDNDKKLFIRWLGRRYDGIDTATDEEAKLIKEKFNLAKEIYSKRTSENDVMEFLIRDKKIKFVTNTKIIKKQETLANMLFNYYEAVHAFLLTEYIKEGFEPYNGQAILDCGGAKGDTVILFKSFYPDSDVYSFECIDENINYINKNVKLNNFQNVKVQSGFLDSKTVKTNSRQTIAIDNYVRENNIKNIGLIKFDIEGAEQEALKGAINTIKEQKPILAIPIYHLYDDVYKIPKFLDNLHLPMEIALKWTEKLVMGADCVLFVKFK